MRTRAIAVAGTKGSPGCSFLSVALARCLAAGNVTTLLLDGDAEGAGLSTLLDASPAKPVVPVDENAFVEHAMQIQQNLWFAELDQTTVGSFNGLDALSAARAGHSAVVVDLGHAAGAIQRQLSAGCDWLLWVVIPDRSGLERADRALESALLGAANVGLVINRIGPGCLDRADEVLSGRHRIPVLARINDDPQIADRLSRGLAVHRERSIRRTLSELARLVHPDVGGGVPSWQ
jgi:MinD superfamily P-loop ATPase